MRILRVVFVHHHPPKQMQTRFVKFRPDNFRPSGQTPWGGRRIANDIKACLGLKVEQDVIGESWEFSADGDFPSRCLGAGEVTLMHLLSDAPETWLSPAHFRLWGARSPLLVKLIDAAHDLSLQLHPPIEASCLASDESGKWEAWYILSREAGAGIYLGLATGANIVDLFDALLHGEDIRPFLHFIPVQPGEMYVIAPRTIHALGAGVCVLEPQIMQPGKRALTFRLHDWNRRYDARGLVAPEGEARPVHTAQAMSWLDVGMACGIELERKARLFGRVLYQDEGLLVMLIESLPYIRIYIFRGSGKFELPLPGEILCMTAVAGRVDFCLDGQWHDLRGGESGVVAATGVMAVFSCQEAEFFLLHCLPSDYEAEQVHCPACTP